MEIHDFTRISITLDEDERFDRETPTGRARIYLIHWAGGQRGRRWASVRGTSIRKDGTRGYSDRSDMMEITDLPEHVRTALINHPRFEH